MDKERTLFIRILTSTCLYALLQFIVSLKLIFPFPLYEACFLIAVGCFIYFDPPKERFTKGNLLFFLTAVFYLLKSEFYWEMVLAPEQMSWFSAQIFTDIFHLLFCALLILLFFLNHTRKGLKALSIGLILLSLLTNSEYIIALALLIHCFFMYKKEGFTKPIYLYLLLVFFLSTKWMVLIL